MDRYGNAKMDTQADPYYDTRQKWIWQKQTTDDLVRRMIMVGAISDDPGAYETFLEQSEDLFHYFLGDRFLRYKEMNEEELKKFYYGKGGLMAIWQRALELIISGKAFKTFPVQEK